MDFKRFQVNNSLKLVRKVMQTAIILAFVFTFGYYFGLNGNFTDTQDNVVVTISRDLPQEQTELDFGLFWRVWDTLETDYFDNTQLTDSEMVYGAIQGMVAAVGDPYTVFLPPKQNKVVQEDLQGEFSGVGIQIGFKGSQLAVIAPLPESPAEEVGIEAGDLIVGIKDEDKGIDRGTVGITLPEAVQTIRGKAGSIVTLLLLREGLDEPIVTDVVRKAIQVPSVRLTFVGENENIAHVEVLKFSQETVKEWDRAVSEILRKQDLGGIILDVRNNPGGFLQHAVELSSDFLETGQIAVVEEGADDYRKEYKVERIGRFRREKVVILINGGSASASEIFAGALRDNNETTLIGQTSFGKGTIQEAKPINGDAGLHITIARWITPAGTWVNEEALVPDIEIKNDPETEDDEQLQRAILELVE